MKRFSLATFPLEGKTVFLRVDYNVPFEKGKIVDNSKIKLSLKTINYLLHKNCKIIIATHFGRPKGKFVKELTVSPLLKELKTLLPKEKIVKLSDCIGKDIQHKIQKAKPKQIFLLENLRFYKQEEQNDPAFAHSLADLADVYINEAFGVSHRKHASVDAITHFIPSIAGITLETEIQELTKALRPRKPSVWIMGGAKLDKVKLLESALQKSKYVLIGGALPFAFLKSKGISVGMSKVDGTSVRAAQKLLRKRISTKIILPIDFVVADSFSLRAKTRVAKYNDIKRDEFALDIGPATVKLFKQYLRKAHTIVWNGPLGYNEWVPFSSGTKDIGRYIVTLTAETICGGGETVDAIKKFYLEHKMTHISSGGGASLTFLAGNKIVGITALEKNYSKFKKRIKK